MSEKSYPEDQLNREPMEQPLDDLRNLYVGHIRGKGFASRHEGDPIELEFTGHALLYGYPIGDRFEVGRVRRLTLNRVQEEHNPGDPTTALSVVGPVGWDDPHNVGSDHIENASFYLYYRHLAQRSPHCQLEDARFPKLDRMVSTLHWHQVSAASIDGVELEMALDQSRVIEQEQSLVSEVMLEPTVVKFHRAGTEKDYDATSHSLPDHCDPPGGSSGWPTLLRQIPLHFVNLSQDKTPEQVYDICEQQLQGVCAVWRVKGALDARVDKSPTHPSGVFQGTAADKTKYAFCSESDANDLRNVRYGPLQSVPVYMVDNIHIPSTCTEFPHHCGGGVTYGCRTPDAYCILKLDEAKENPRLLAHELGHVLGLNHPNGATVIVGSGGGLPFSSWESVMKPTGNTGQPNPDKNTVFNCRIFLDPSSIKTCFHTDEPWVLNPLVDTVGTAGGVSDFFRPDPVHHFVCDHPQDSGEEPFFPPGGDWASSSFVWNRHSPNPGLLSPGAAPEHQEPHPSNTNHAFVQLKYGPGAKDPVCVHFYLVHPRDRFFLWRNTAVPLKPGGGHRLLFDSASLSTDPFVVGHVEWRWDEVPGNLPDDCYLFAIAHSVDEVMPFSSPENMTFSDFYAHVLVDNDVAGRYVRLTG